MAKKLPTDFKPWKRQRQLKREDIPEPAEIISMAQSFTNLQERALFIIAYLTAGRISEIVQQKFLRKVSYKTKTITDENGLTRTKVIKNKHGSATVENVEKIPLAYKGITKDNLSIVERNGRKVLLISMQNRKNKEVKRKQIPIPVDKEKELLKMLFEYVNKLQPGKPLFNFETWKARNILKKIHMNPHYIRDIRLTHMVIYHDFNEYFLTKFAGWKDGRPAERYIRLKWSDMLQKY